MRFRRFGEAEFVLIDEKVFVINNRMKIEFVEELKRLLKRAALSVAISEDLPDKVLTNLKFSEKRR